MKIRGKVLSVNKININGEYIDEVSLKKAIDRYKSDYKNGFLYFETHDNDCLTLENIAGIITKLDVEDGFFIVEGETLQTPSGIRMESALKYGGHFSFAMNAFYNDFQRITLVEEIYGFCVNQRQEPLEEWEIKEIKDEDQISEVEYKKEHEEEILIEEDDDLNDDLDENDIKNLMNIIKKVVKK